MAWVQVASEAEVPAGSLIETEAAGRYIALCNVEGELRAMDGTCPHQGGPLGEGSLNGEFVTCPWHMWDFHSVTGACAFNERVRVEVFEVRRDAGAVMVNLPNA